MSARRVATADLLSGLRLVAAPVLPLVALRPRAFLALAALGGVTDALDGPVARRAGTAGPRGAVVDSVADVAFFGGLVAACLRAQPERARSLTPAVVAVAAVRGCAAATGVVRWGRPVLLHTWSNKAAGVGAGVGLACLTAWGRRGPLAAASLVAAGAAAEELWRVVTAAQMPDVDAPGVLGWVASRLARP
ncbi:CDP-alcohol phosphatidyltransferase family protein [Actinotalea fermentans]|uniref:CDP-alcohol phosphatidyltransferase n=1 Tax=Actinotalea fermentans TaxID=43671 RepID=A0A511YU66_9CELL|nr:CDP-alcohol phosphatidyltransferase family protein [Actinotalea fermentans]KGM17017.1 hypothetical protein N867_11525 [Actinotalea fermentans ATCC 43279 = JCM 9966 = DSM 3133]GEN78743.1 hypothetical protein AFE02nite_04770 [Actinotalea fermentans]